MYGSLEELCQAQYVRVPGQDEPSKPWGQVPDWVATTIWASVRSVIPWAAAKASGSVAIWAWVAPGVGVVSSLNVSVNTEWLKIGPFEGVPYCDKMVDQLSFGWPGCRTPRPAKKLSRYWALAIWLLSVVQLGPHSSR